MLSGTWCDVVCNGNSMGILIAKNIKEELLEVDEDIWQYLDKVIQLPDKYLPMNLAEKLHQLYKLHGRICLKKEEPCFNCCHDIH